MRVIVCGAGVVGLWCALALRARGHAVTVLDRHGIERDGCSFGNLGLVVPSHLVPLASPGALRGAIRSLLDSRAGLYLQPRFDAELLRWCLRFARASTAAHVRRCAPLLRDLHLASRAAYERFARQTGGAFELATRGLLVLCATERGLREEAIAAQAAEALGVPAEVIPAARAAELEPGVRMRVVGAVRYPLDAHLDPARLMAALASHAQTQGVTLLLDTEVHGWRAASGIIEAVRTSRGELDADAFVLAAGVWSSVLARHLGLELPLQAGRGYTVTVRSPQQQLERPVLLHEAHAAAVPVGDALRIGGTMELTSATAPPRPERVQSLVTAARRYFPGLLDADFPVAPVWSGLRPCSPDGLPYIGRFARYRNLCAATGHAMMGVSLGPATGELVAQMLDGEPPTVPIEAFSPDRHE